eukprot:jgi/Chlat1/4475/Chrsp29S04571
MAEADWTGKTKATLAMSKLKLFAATKNAGTSVAGAFGSAKEKWFQYKPELSSKFGAVVDKAVESSKKAAESVKQTSEQVRQSQVAQKLTKNVSEVSKRVADAYEGSSFQRATEQLSTASRQAFERLELGRKNSKYPVVGLPLDSTTVARDPVYKKVPRVVISAIDFIQANGLDTEGLFREEASTSAVDFLMTQMQQDPSAAIPEGTDVHTVASFLKFYLHNLPEPLLTFKLYATVVNAGAESSPEEITELLTMLPASNRATLEQLSSLLSQINKKSAINKMNAENLGRVLAPTLLWPKAKTPTVRSPGRNTSSLDGDDEQLLPASDGVDMFAALAEVRNIANVVQYIIEHHDVLFADAAHDTWQ